MYLVIAIICAGSRRKEGKVALLKFFCPGPSLPLPPHPLGLESNYYYINKTIAKLLHLIQRCTIMNSLEGF